MVLGLYYFRKLSLVRCARRTQDRVHYLRSTEESLILDGKRTKLMLRRCEKCHPASQVLTFLADSIHKNEAVC
jgi:hypothetical protein